MRHRGAESVLKENDGEVTALLNAWAEGDRAVGDELMPLIYGDLRQMAVRSLHGERAGHTLQPTALIHEAYLRLFEGKAPHWKNRSQFFAAAAKVMRRVLVDHARARNRHKRGGGAVDLTLEEAVAEVTCERPEQLVALDEALRAFEVLDPVKTSIVELHFFAGLSVAETAAATGMSKATVSRHWRAAKAWLLRELTAPS